MRGRHVAPASLHTGAGDNPPRNKHEGLCGVNILALDLATNTGFAIGDSKGKPTSWSRRLKTPEDDVECAFGNLGLILRDMFMVECPDLVVVEAPMSMGGMVKLDEQSDRGFKFTSNPSTIYMLGGLVASVYTICKPYGIRVRKANVQTVRKDFLGVARPSNPKKVVLDRCRQLGWLDRTCRDDNRADALALWSFACHQQVERGYTAPATGLINAEAAE